MQENDSNGTLKYHVVRIGVPDTVRADALHESFIIPPVQWPARHVMTTRTVDNARAKETLCHFVHVLQALAT